MLSTQEIGSSLQDGQDGGTKNKEKGRESICTRNYIKRACKKRKRKVEKVGIQSAHTSVKYDKFDSRQTSKSCHRYMWHMHSSECEKEVSRYRQTASGDK